MFLDTRAHRQQAPGLRTISFEENRGQASAAVRFVARGQGYNLLLGREYADLLLRHSGRKLSLTTRLVDANAHPSIQGEEKLDGKVHYLRREQSLTDIPTYGRVRYQAVYPGIDLIYYGNQQQLEYDFVVRPQADAGRIALEFQGADELRVDSSGNLVVRAGSSEIVQHKPAVYQTVHGARKSVDAQFRLIAENTVGFELGPYDRNATLVIDPVLSYSTFLGGSNGDDDARAVATDSSGNVYVTGSTTSTNFQIASPFQATARGQDLDDAISDAFVTKLNAAGNTMVYSTYLGGISDDDANSIAVDSSGNVVIVGSTASSDFPATSGAIRRTCNSAGNGSCLDAFVAKLNAAGSALVYSTYLGGTGDDEARGVAVDSAGAAYIAGKTLSTNFPTTSGAFSTDASTGGFVSKLSATGALVYSTYFAEPKAIAVDSAGNAFITGATASSTSTGTDVFLTKLNASGTAAVYSQFIRGTRDDIGNAVAVDGSGNAYVAGETSSINFPTTSDALQPAFGGGPAFATFDSGTNWTPMSRGFTRSSLYAIAIEFRGPAAPGPTILYAGADDEAGGGLFKSADGGSTWTSSSTGISDPRIHALLADFGRVGAIFAGTRTLGVFKTTNGGATWTATSLNNVFVTALAGTSTASLYAGTDANGIYKSIDGGTTWTAVNNGLPASSVRSIVVTSGTQTAVYAATSAGIYKSTDGGANWISVNSGLFDSNVNALTVDARNSNLIYAGTNSAGIFRTLNGGTFWLASNSGITSSSAGSSVSALTTDSSGTIYAAVGESNTSRIYKTANGTTWTATSLATARATALTVDLSASSSVYAATSGGSDAFVAKWNPSGTLVYSTYLGGYRDDAANAIAVDSSGNVYVAGDTSSTNFPVTNAVQAAFAGGSDVVTDAFAVKLNTSGAISYATYLGGSGNDFGKGIAVDSSGNAIVVGTTGSADFPSTAAALTATRPGLFDAFVAKIADTNVVSYSVASRGGISTTSQGAGSTISAGYGRIQPTTGSTTPSGLAIFGFRQSNVLVSEAAVPASTLISSGRTYAQVGQNVDTGLAIANPNSSPVSLSFYFTRTSGEDFGAGTTTIPANGQIAAFLDQTPFNAPQLTRGTFTFTASLPVSVIALRGLTNERFEFLITTLPVADLSVVSSTDNIVFPHVAQGDGWSTQLLLVNATDVALAGNVEFPAPLPTQGYAILPHSSAVVAPSYAGGLVTGSARVVPLFRTRAPVGVAVFSFKNSSGITVTEAGVQATGVGNAFRLYAESSGVPGQVGSIQTGVAIVNTSSTTAAVNFELTTLKGSSIGLTGSASIPGNGQTAMFLGQIQGFAALQTPFQGVLRISTASSPGISVIGLRGRYNERGDFLITTTQPVNESVAASTSELFFPHLADGGGYTTQFILFNGSSDQSSSGSLRFFGQSGQALNLTVR